MIHIFYRHYEIDGKESWRPDWFDYEGCFKNLLKTIETHENVKLTIIYDGETDSNFIFNYDHKIIKIKAGSDLNSFTETLNYIENLNLDNDDIIYLLENDYLHLNGWVEKVFDFFSYNNKHYLTLYDHADKYMDSYNNLRSKIISTETHHFRTTPSTCGSFLVKYNILKEDIKYHKFIPQVLYTITDVPVDHGKFLILNTLQNREIYSPIPGLTTHCLNNLLSPNIDWYKIANNE